MAPSEHFDGPTSTTHLQSRVQGEGRPRCPDRRGHPGRGLPEAPDQSVFKSDDERSREAARIAELERLVGQQDLEMAALKKASTWLGGAPNNGGMS